jgi:hypothetical protein
LHVLIPLLQLNLEVPEYSFDEGSGKLVVG